MDITIKFGTDDRFMWADQTILLYTSGINGDPVLLLAFQNPMLILWNANLTQYFI